MNVLGLQFGHDGSGAIVSDGKLVAAIASERITRYKKQRGVTRSTLEYLLKKAGLTLNQIDLVTVNNWYWDLVDGKELIDKGAEGFRLFGLDGREVTTEEWQSAYNPAAMLNRVYMMEIDGHRIPALPTAHELAHTYYAFATSPYDDAFAVAVDVSDGGTCNHAFAFYQNTPDAQLAEALLNTGSNFPVGAYYNQMCEYLGFYPALVDAGKVMALAAYGEPLPDWEEIVWQNLASKPDILNRDQYLHTLFRAGIKSIPKRRVLWPQLKGEGGEPDPVWLNKDDWNSDLSKTLAATAQKVLEKTLLNLYAELSKACGSGERNLCLAGGTMLNCVANGIAVNSGLFDHVWIAPACGDDGLSIGSALYAANHIEVAGGSLQPVSRAKKIHSFREVFEGGRVYSEPEVTAAIEEFTTQLGNDNIKVSRPGNDEELVKYVASKVADGKIIGWFYRGSELGPRALGHRSIIADPRRADMKDILNARVKHREGFRPFAPVVPAENCHEWFELPSHIVSPFMLFSVKCLQPERIPSGMHIDNTARVQTVDPDNNGRFYHLVKEFGNQTGVPVIINTSFNVQGEPIVETPQDAIRCFMGTQIDVLVLEDRLLEKPQQ